MTPTYDWPTCWVDIGAELMQGDDFRQGVGCAAAGQGIGIAHGMKCWPATVPGMAIDETACCVGTRESATP